MMTVTLPKEIERQLNDAARQENIPPAMLLNRWLQTGALAEQNPDKLSGDISEFLATGKYHSVSLQDAPLSPGMTAEKENESVRMMMKMLVYALKQRAPDHSCVTRAMSLMKSLGMYSVKDILR